MAVEDGKDPLLYNPQFSPPRLGQRHRDLCNLLWFIPFLVEHRMSATFLFHLASGTYPEHIVRTVVVHLLVDR